MLFLITISKAIDENIFSLQLDLKLRENRTLLLVEPKGGRPNASLLCRLSTFSTAFFVRGLGLGPLRPGELAPDALLALLAAGDDPENLKRFMCTIIKLSRLRKHRILTDFVLLSLLNISVYAL